MSDQLSSKNTPSRQIMSKTVSDKEHRKLKAREQNQGPWFGLGMFGLVGWSVAIPTILGIALGIWIDTRWPSSISWTLTLLAVGIVAGCLTAWVWIKQESRGDE